MTFPYIRPYNINPPPSQTTVVGKCVYCDAGCQSNCVDNKTEAECAALHVCNGNASYQWTPNATCGGLELITCASSPPLE